MYLHNACSQVSTKQSPPTQVFRPQWSLTQPLSRYLLPQIHPHSQPMHTYSCFLSHSHFTLQLPCSLKCSPYGPVFYPGQKNHKQHLLSQNKSSFLPKSSSKLTSNCQTSSACPGGGIFLTAHLCDPLDTFHFQAELHTSLLLAQSFSDRWKHSTFNHAKPHSHCQWGMGFCCSFSATWLKSVATTMGNATDQASGLHPSSKPRIKCSLVLHPSACP